MELQPALTQGAQLHQYAAEHLRSATDDLAMLQLSSSPGIQSYTEGLTERVSSGQDPGSKQSAASDTEREFNEVLREYSTLYRQFSQDVVRKAQVRGAEGAASSVISSSDGHYSYVNDFGYTHMYSTVAWEHNSPTCPSSPSRTLSADELGQLKSGPPMGQGQACGVAGKNVRDAGSDGQDPGGEVAWVDAQGYRHAYPPKLWDSKDPSCDIPVVALTTAEYEGIPEAGPMLETSTCEPIGLEPDTWRQLQALNSRLIELATKMAKELDAMSATDERLQKRLDASRQQLQQYAAALTADQDQLASARQSATSAGARRDQTALLAGSRWAHYLVWLVLATAVAGLVLHAVVKGRPGAVTSAIAVVGALVILYMGVRWVHRHIYFR